MLPKLKEAPSAYNGTLTDLYDNWAKYVLLPLSAVEEFHRQFCAYVQSEDPLFLVRYSPRRQERGELGRTDKGALYRPTDNAPAWWIHYQLFTGQFQKYTSFAEFIKSAPCRMFDVRLPDSVNKAGWHVAHIFKVKDGDLEFRQWGRDELVRRTARSIHPCNYFYIPIGEWRRYGEDPTVIAFFYDKFRMLYRSIWDEFLSLIGGSPITVPVGVSEYKYSFSAKQTLQLAPKEQANYSAEPNQGSGQRYTIKSDESLPPTHLSHFVRRVHSSDVSMMQCSNWTGNDETARNHDGKVNLSKSPLRLRLSWKKSPKDSAHLIGVYDIDLRQLLDAGYVRLAANSKSEIRLRFYHDWDGVIYIQVKKNQGLPIGRMP